VAQKPAARTLARSGGSRFHKRLRDRRRPVLTRFEVSRRTVYASDSPVRITYLIRDRSRVVRVTLAFVRPGHGTVFRARLGWQRTGVAHTYRWSGSNEGRLMPEGSYKVRVTARDRSGNRLVRGTTVERTTEPVSLSDHRFPVQGLYNLGGASARFGAPRSGHIHKGQDIMAAEGTPVVAPTAGVISWRSYQAAGAGYYLVLHASTEAYDYVFMHLQRDSLLVSKGDNVRTGQQLARVGHTGASDGSHLHFEIWDGPWSNGGHPIDPLPILRSWVTVAPVSRASR
jgi:murein DD-endopeptidase MepM/ murein hydrolase activator NlpD